MKRVLRLSALSLGLLVLISGCSSNANGGTAGPVSQGAATSQGGNMRRPDFGQPQRQADLRGVVTSIVGNEVSLLKLAVNAGRRASSTPATSGNGSTSESGPSISLGAIGGSGGNRVGGGQGGGFGGPAGGNRDGGGTTDRAAMIASLKAMSTGSETVIVPVGIKMMKFSVDTNTKKRTAVEATLNDITADKMISVWLNASVTDKKVAEFVLIN